MFNLKTKTSLKPVSENANGTTLISAATVIHGDIQSQGDLRVDGTVKGNIQCASKVVVGQHGVIEGNIKCLHADISGKVTGNIQAKELLQLNGSCNVNGNIYTTRLQVEPSATFNGECHMGANVIELNQYEQPAAI
ncbi:MAG: polymer-forming cytoskeletal protein [Chitinophagaceae bacterium]|nr:polymer-forming cytoskeletal protein [Chitinophagaceae bacterium]